MGFFKDYFYKYAQADAGRTMMQDEYYSMNELHGYMAASLPKPLGYGKFIAEGPSTYFILYDFVKFKEKDLDAEILCTKIVDLHRSSTSPNGKFGFQVCGHAMVRHRSLHSGRIAGHVCSRRCHAYDG